MARPKLDDLILGAYDAALAPELWPELLVRVADFLGGTATHLLAFEVSSGRAKFGAVGRVPQEGHFIYVRDYAARDLRLPRILRWKPDSPWTDELILSADEVRACPVHHDFLAPRELWHILGVTLAPSEREQGVLAVLRSRNKGPFGESEARALERLVDHFTRAVQVQLRLGVVEARTRTLSACTDALAFALLVTNDKGRVRYTNAAAEVLLADNDGLTTSRGFLAAASRCDTGALRRFIADAARPANGKMPAIGGGALTIERPSGKRALQVMVLPLPTRSSLPGEIGRGSVAVLVSDPAGPRLASGSVLSELYGLTPAEAEVAVALARGWSLRDIAEARGVSRETIRTQLKSVYDKTGVHRQSELVRLVHSGPDSLILDRQGIGR